MIAGVAEMRELSQAEMIERGDDYFEIADAIHPFGDAQLRALADVLREAARHLLRGDENAHRGAAGRILHHGRYLRDLDEGVKQRLRRYVGARIWALIGSHFTSPQAQEQTAKPAPPYSPRGNRRKMRKTDKNPQVTPLN